MLVQLFGKPWRAKMRAAS